VIEVCLSSGSALWKLEECVAAFVLLESLTYIYCCSMDRILASSSWSLEASEVELSIVTFPLFYGSFAWCQAVVYQPGSGPPAMAYMCKLFWYWKSHLGLGGAMQLRMYEMGAEHVNEKTKGEHGGLLVCNSMSKQNACSLDCGQRGPQVHPWKAHKWKVIFSHCRNTPSSSCGWTVPE
jgi:hypothetical protein